MIYGSLETHIISGGKLLHGQAANQQRYRLDRKSVVWHNSNAIIQCNIPVLNCRWSIKYCDRAQIRKHMFIRLLAMPLVRRSYDVLWNILLSQVSINFQTLTTLSIWNKGISIYYNLEIGYSILNFYFNIDKWFMSTWLVKYY